MELQGIASNNYYIQTNTVSTGHVSYSAIQDHGADQSIDKTIQQLNKQMRETGKEYKFDLAMEGGMSVVQLKDGDRILFQSPPEAILQADMKLRESLGILIDQRR